MATRSQGLHHTGTCSSELSCTEARTASRLQHSSGVAAGKAPSTAAKSSQHCELALCITLHDSRPGKAQGALEHRRKASQANRTSDSAFMALSISIAT